MSKVPTAPSPATWADFYGPNLGYVLEWYDRYTRDPDSVDPETRALFDRLGPPPVGEIIAPGEAKRTAADRPTIDPGVITKLTAATRLISNIRIYGHLEARIYPLGDERPAVPFLRPEAYGITENDLSTLPASWVLPEAPADARTALDVVRALRRRYTGPIAYEFAHVFREDERRWLQAQVESGTFLTPKPPEEQKRLLRRLIEVEEFETFLHKTFVGQKRFSIEGVDMLVPMVDAVIRGAARFGARQVFIGMAHRGRLNVLAHVLDKPYAKIFAEFHASPNKDLVPSEGSMGINYGWTGDVRYHLGARHEDEAVHLRLTLANNPSHLEFVNPVVQGFTRAAQEDRSRPGLPGQDLDGAWALLIHGDAAFPGEGVVAETLNLSGLAGYRTGGTLHIITNNLLGFTTERADDRSTRYASDLAKGFEIPVVHVNADEPEACLAAVELAVEYRRRFHKDFLIDLVGYRRWGHNESDDPAMTQPVLYSKINAHPSVGNLYGHRLADAGTIRSEEARQMREEVQEHLRRAYAEVTSESVHPDIPDPGGEDPELPENTGVPEERLAIINEALTDYPAGFRVYPKVDRILKRRQSHFREGGRIDWGHAEALALGSILLDGVPIRISGQDTQRGTFGHRLAVLHDLQTGEPFVPLQHLPQSRVSFAIYNSPLTETAVMGFEYGYSVQAPETLVIWEAQFGDFANVDQVIFDQFLASGRAKWGQTSGMVVLLPHGYEGQGPEHSSARLERFLQLSAEHNWTVANPTTSAQYFHLLRLQAWRLQHAPRPLVVLTPKSLLRHPRAASEKAEFTSGRFQPVLDDPRRDISRSAIKRVLLCSGKISVDLFAALEKDPEAGGSLGVVRVEQLYPFPKEELSRILAGYPGAEEVVWVQEEPRNMGSWAYVAPRMQALLPPGQALKYVGRPERSSPAEGLADAHGATQAKIVQQALQH
ncbi:2-oxoglutarate dehydrogenase E1 component [Kyrpidia spormannii]|uniref:2-oxoglutarate dehydrogenase E1 component n=1 Tax=Kyrpidia spormannii TaxID=2055160 RepID=A0A2K8N6Y9_9BACL|nr:2-oxoglutarate dehydrogenase E1 component [Kyrpidia spormannii]ATY85119.1 2-oxoglutarate dehydrogenase E1 component [Kyrpidia spormannii]